MSKTVFKSQQMQHIHEKRKIFLSSEICIYFSLCKNLYLHVHRLPPSVQILSVVTDVYSRHPGMMHLHQVASKFILFLIAVSTNIHLSLMVQRTDKCYRNVKTSILSFAVAQNKCRWRCSKNANLLCNTGK